MKAEEERRQLEDKLQAEALLQQMEELKAKEMEVRACPRPHGCLSAACCYKMGISNAVLKRDRIREVSLKNAAIRGSPF